MHHFLPIIGRFKLVPSSFVSASFSFMFSTWSLINYLLVRQFYFFNFQKMLIYLCKCLQFWPHWLLCKFMTWFLNYYTVLQFLEASAIAFYPNSSSISFTIMFELCWLTRIKLLVLSRLRPVFCLVYRFFSQFLKVVTVLAILSCDFNFFLSNYLWKVLLAD